MNSSHECLPGLCFILRKVARPTSESGLIVTENGGPLPDDQSSGSYSVKLNVTSEFEGKLGLTGGRVITRGLDRTGALSLISPTLTC